MGVTTTTTTFVVCDNPNCPGNDLDPNSTDEWMFASYSKVTEIEEPPLEEGGEPIKVKQNASASGVFCCAECFASVTAAAVAGEAWPSA